MHNEATFAVAPYMSEKSLQSSLVVQEGESVRLSCVAEGLPPPKFSWKRADDSPIKIGHWSRMSLQFLVSFHET